MLEDVIFSRVKKHGTNRIVEYLSSMDADLSGDSSLQQRRMVEATKNVNLSRNDCNQELV
ncbi:hypothetical protein M514_05820 [Trichuris suis]|uniref:Uncharacterized protein n=1 Tax=Trichuris suis TaxID=68888 RepID=A0A085M7Z3_9BILA|nr:hypothetical protein M513_05820 [Trichuris suis]KFD66432.1 hypothetical protein M514_05820 [Trichuris suis]